MHVHVNSCCQDEIDAYAPEYAKMKDFGDHVTEGQSDPQYMFLAQRLSALDDGWKELLQMWDSRQQGLSQDLNLQVLEKTYFAKPIFSEIRNFCQPNYSVITTSRLHHTYIEDQYLKKE